MRRRISMAETTSERFVGTAMKRREDPRFITGRGLFVDDINLPGMQRVVFLRSPYAHAKITRLDTSAAEQHPGVLKVYTGKDFSHVGGLPCGVVVPGAYQKTPNHPVIAIDEVNYVGEIVAAVVAADTGTAKDAAQLIEVEYEPLPGTVDTEKSTEPGAPEVHPDAPNNIAIDWTYRNGDIDSAFNEADVVVKQRLVNQRLIPNAIEPRAVAARFDQGTGELTVWDTDQNPHLIR